ncbi:MAG: T9SS type A sorting domain-containing protein [Brumimicrobium sp.]|nr:T9SS type A sorting domain-containing protein [Brumimicrobium sp.]
MSTNSGLNSSDVIYALGVNGNTVYASNNSNGTLHKSTDNTNWSAVSMGNSYPTKTNYQAFYKDGSSFYVGSIGYKGHGLGYNGCGIYKTDDDGTTWQHLGLTSKTVTAIDISGDNILASTEDPTYNSSQLSLFKITESDNVWSYSMGGFDARSVTTVKANGANALLFGQDNDYQTFYGYRSTNNGMNWPQVGATPNGGLPKTIAFAGSIIYIGEQYVYVSTDNGNSWSSVITGLPSSAYQINSLIVKGNQLYAGTKDGIYKNTVGQNSWTAINNGLTNMFVNSLHAYGDTLFAGTQGGGVFRSIDDGANWSDVSNEIPLFSIVTSFTSWDNYVAVATSDNGVYVTPNNGDYWEAINLGLADTSITCMTVSSNYVWAGTNEMGVWKRDKADIVVTAPATSHISNFKEEPSIQINPNPIKDIFTIQLPSEFQNKENEIFVYNLMGEIVLQQKLIHTSLEVDASTYPAGAYIVKIQCPQKVFTKMMVKE